MLVRATPLPPLACRLLSVAVLFSLVSAGCLFVPFLGLSPFQRWVEQRELHRQQALWNLQKPTSYSLFVSYQPVLDDKAYMFTGISGQSSPTSMTIRVDNHVASANLPKTPNELRSIDDVLLFLEHVVASPFAPYESTKMASERGQGYFYRADRVEIRYNERLDYPEVVYLELATDSPLAMRWLFSFRVLE